MKSSFYNLFFFLYLLVNFSMIYAQPDDKQLYLKRLDSLEHVIKNHKANLNDLAKKQKFLEEKVSFGIEMANTQSSTIVDTGSYWMSILATVFAVLSLFLAIGTIYGIWEIRKLKKLGEEENKKWLTLTREHTNEVEELKNIIDELINDFESIIYKAQQATEQLPGSSIKTQKLEDEFNNTIKKIERKENNNTRLTLDEQYFKALRYYTKGEYKLAIELFNYIIQNGFQKKGIYTYRGTSHLVSNEFHKALKDYKKAIKLEYQNAINYSNLGNVYFMLQKYEKALQNFNKAISLNKNNSSFYLNRANVFEAIKDYEKAIVDCSMVIRLDKNNEIAYNKRSYLYFKRKAYNKALRDVIDSKIIKYMNNATKNK